MVCKIEHFKDIFKKAYTVLEFFITMMLVPMMLGVITTIWFMIGGIIDIKRLFLDLEKTLITEYLWNIIKIIFIETNYSCSEMG